MTGQETKPGAGEDDENCSGTVIALTAEKITVRRTLPTLATEDRPFLLKPETTVDGKLRMNARVTVNFIQTPDGQVARHIVVRSSK